MRVPARLEPLLERGIIDDVIQPLQSGKEAAVYVVLAEGEERVAKVYKESDNRSFKHRSAYAEGRKVRNSRQQRAMAKKSRYGREEIEAAWRDAEVDAIYRCRAAGVRVPEPHAYIDGVLIMEMIQGPDGGAAPRLVDLSFDAKSARVVFDKVLREVVKMLCAGVVHGDLSDFNILMGRDGPVIIDFPQWLDAAQNRNAQQMLVRDVDNLQSFLGRYAEALRGRRFGREMWQLFERNELRPETELTGKARHKKPKDDPYALLREIEELEQEARARREKLGLPMRPARRPVVQDTPPPKAKAKEARPAGEPPADKKKRRRRRRKGGRDEKAPEAAPAERPSAAAAAIDLDDLDALLLAED
jgi:RIO kinase 1